MVISCFLSLRDLPKASRGNPLELLANALFSSLRADFTKSAWQSRVVASCAFFKSLATPLRLLKKLRLRLVLPRSGFASLAMTEF